MIKVYDLTAEAYETYRQSVKGNEETSYDLARKKLTRNIKLGVKKKGVLNFLKLQQEFIYGNLKITVKSGSIVKIENHTADVVKGWKLNKKEYERLSNELGIPDSKFKKKKRHHRVS